MKPQTDKKEAEEKVCGNCFWLRYCHSNLTGIFLDSSCLFQPSAFIPAVKVKGRKVMAREIGFEIFPESFFEPDDEKREVSQLELAEKYLVIDALMRKQWSQKRAGEYLGISQRMVNYLCRKHKLRHPNWWKQNTFNEEMKNDEDE